MLTWVAEPWGRMGLGPPTFISGRAWPPTFKFRILLLSLSNTICIGSIVKVNRSMKKMLQNFDSILSILFVVWQDFVIVWQNIPCTVCHTAMAAYNLGVVEQ